MLPIRRELIRAFAVLDEWFDKDEEFYHFKIANDAKDVREILEHVVRNVQYLLSFADKREAKTLLEIENLIGTLGRDKFKYELGESMNSISLSETRRELRDQLYRCLLHLELFSNAEGNLYEIGSLKDAGVINVYRSLYAIARHIKRHILELKKNESEYLKLKYGSLECGYLESGYSIWLNEN